MKKLMILLLGTVAIMVLQGCSTRQYYHLPAAEFDEIDYVFPTREIQVRNIKVVCIDEGEGPQALLLIHGLGSNVKGWLRNIPAWSQDFRVIAVDLPGYGKSDKGHYAYSLSFYARVLTEMMDKLDLAEATFVGHSMGAQIAMVAAMQYPERVNKLVLISPAGFERFEEGEGDWLSGVVTPELVRDTSIRRIAVNLQANFFRPPAEAEFMITDRIRVRGADDFENYCYAVSKNVAAMLDEPVWDRLDQISLPTLIIFGENDGLIPNPYLHGGHTADIAMIGQGGIPDSRLVMVSDCGHFVQFEKPEQANQAVLDFVR